MMKFTALIVIGIVVILAGVVYRTEHKGVIVMDPNRLKAHHA